MCDFDKVKSARLGTLIHNYRFLCRNGDIDSDFCDKCLDAMAKLAQAKTADEIDSVCKDVRYGDKHIAAIPLGNVLDLPLPAELIRKIRSIRKPSRLMFFLADTTKTQLFNEYKLTQQEFELVEAEANKIGYSFIDNEKSNI